MNDLTKEWLPRRLALVLLGAASALAPVWAHATTDKAAWDALRQGGVAVLFRHALAPGVGDPPGMVVGQCKTQRNLNDEGRTQARRMGERFKAERVAVSAVWSSQWCRASDTARLMGVGKVEEKQFFNSFFGDRQNEPAQTAEALIQLGKFKGPSALVVVTHQVNISALTGVVPASGEGVVIRMKPGTAEPVVLGRVLP